MMWSGAFEYQPLKGNLEDFQLKALQNRPDLRAARQGVTAATSQYDLQKAIGKQDVTVQANYSHVNAINAIPFMAVFRCRFSTATRAKSPGRVSRSPRRKSRKRQPTAKP